jgi:hypothetical protein
LALNVQALKIKRLVGRDTLAARRFTFFNFDLQAEALILVR